MHFEAVTKPALWLQVLGLFLAVSMVAVTGVSWWRGEPDVIGVVVLALSCVLVLALSAWFALTPVRTQIDGHGVAVSYWPFGRTIPWSSVSEVLEGDRVDGIGHGFGYRWEGKGRIAFRLGGPMITVMHDSGRLGVSVPDPDAALAAADAVQRATK